MVNTMPDIAKEISPELSTELDRVGMSRIELPVRLKPLNGPETHAAAKLEAYVSLNDPRAKGIHMSRLFLLTQEALTKDPLSFALLGDLLGDFLSSHKGLSHCAFIKVNFDYMTQRKALKSEHSGWRNYPVVMMARLEQGQFKFVLGTEILYSSTCPCSAALARQLIQEQFNQDFPQTSLDRQAVLNWLGSTQGIVATPHSQRSEAQVRVVIERDYDPGFDELIDLIENCLQTPVQGAVKREDEQEFARLNGQNLMFCEDAARRIKHALDKDRRFLDYWARVEHRESLHPHDAVAIITKGKDCGFNPDFHF